MLTSKITGGASADSAVSAPSPFDASIVSSSNGAISSITLAILIVWCHRANIVRISNRTENKLSFGKKRND